MQPQLRPEWGDQTASSYGDSVEATGCPQVDGNGGPYVSLDDHGNAIRW